MIRDRILEACDEDPDDCNMYLKADELQSKVDKMAIACRNARTVHEAKLMVEVCCGMQGITGVKERNAIFDVVCRCPVKCCSLFFFHLMFIISYVRYNWSLDLEDYPLKSHPRSYITTIYWQAALKEHNIIDAVCQDMLHILDTIAANLGNPEDVLMWCEKARGDYQRYLAEIWHGEFLSKASQSYEKTMRWQINAPPVDEGVAERVLVHRYSAALNLSILEGDIRGNFSDGMKIAQEVHLHAQLYTWRANTKACDTQCLISGA